MCLVNSQPAIAKLLKANKQELTVYKFLRREKSGLYSPFKCTKYRVGINTSNAFFDGPSTAPYVNNGLHVYRTKRMAQRQKASNEVVVKFTAYLNDLIGANENEMVFHNLVLSKADYDAAMKSPKKKVK